MSTTPSNELLEYVKQFFGDRNPVPPSVYAGVSFVGDFAQLVLHRSGQFQTQLCLCKPNSEIPDHGHPGVESFLVHVTGDIDIRIDGNPIYPRGEPHELENGLCSKNGCCRAISAGQSHGATIGPSGGAFITCQRWTGEPPTTVELDWDGPALSDEHDKKIKQR